MSLNVSSSLEKCITILKEIHHSETKSEKITKLCLEIFEQIEEEIKSEDYEKTFILMNFLQAKVSSREKSRLYNITIQFFSHRSSDSNAYKFLKYVDSSIGGPNFIHAFVKRQNHEIVNAFLKNNSILSVLHKDEDGMTLMDYVLKNNDVLMFKLLSKHGYRFDITSIPSKQVDNALMRSSILKEIAQNVECKEGFDSLKLLRTMDYFQLLPTRFFECGNARYFISNKTITIAGMLHRKYKIFFVEIDAKLYPRLIYWSESQAYWRLVNCIWKNYIGKSLNESAINLPITVNLRMIDSDNYNETLLELDSLNPRVASMFKSFVIFNANTYEESSDPLVSQTLIKDVDFDNEDLFKVSKKSERNYEFTQGKICIPKDPESCTVLYPSMEPSFVLASKPYRFISREYGEVTSRIIPSINGKNSFLFYETSNGEVFISNIERNDSTITKQGLRFHYIDGEYLTTPLHEYPFQFPDKWSDETKSSSYISTWKYLKLTPIIKKYCLFFHKKP